MRPRPSSRRPARALALLLAIAGPVLAQAESAECLAESIAELAHPDVLDTCRPACCDDALTLTEARPHATAGAAAIRLLDSLELSWVVLGAPSVASIRSDLAGNKTPHESGAPSPPRHLWLVTFRC